MPSINMIAARRQENRRQERNVRTLLYAVGGEIGLVTLAAFALTIRMVGAHSQIADLSDQLQKLEPKVKAIQQLQTQTAALLPKVQTLDGAKSDTLFWYSNFYAITRSLPEQTWLTALGTGNSGTAATAEPGAASGTDPTLNLTGVAMSQATVGDTMLRMNQSPYLDHVDLAFVQQSKIGTANTVSFQMTVHLKPEPALATSGSAKGASDAQKS